MADELDDRALVAKAQAGDTRAFEALVERHRDKVYALALHLVRTQADAAEVVQETFISAWRKLAEFRGDAVFGTWLHRIAGNFALMKLRHRKVVSQVETDLEGPQFSERGTLVQQIADWRRGTEEQVLDAELARAIQQACDALPEAHRQVFLLRDVDGLSYEQIAEIVGETVAAIKSRLHRARLALREAIDRYYLEHEA